MEQQAVIFNHSVDQTFLIGVGNGRYHFIRVNNAFLNATGFTKEQVEGKYVEEIIPANLHAEIFSKYQQAIRERQTIQWENSSDYPGGKRTGIISITPVFNEEDRCTILVGTVHDITERKKAELKLRAREQELDLIYNTVSDIIFLLAVEPGPRYRFSSVNTAFLETTGLTAAQVEGRYVDEIIPGPSLKIVLPNYQQAISERRKIQWEETSPYPAGSKTGIVTITPVFNDAGECDMLVGAVHDITEQKMVQEEKDKVTYLLNERVKELTTLYRADQLLKSEQKPVDILLQELATILPTGWQYPDITEARIVLGDQQYSTPGFTQGVNSQTAMFPLPGGSMGKIEVVYTIQTPPEKEGAFLEEERNLINMLAEMLRVYFARKVAVEQLVKERDLSDRIIETLPGLFYMIDEKGRYLRWNKLKETVSGFTHGEIGSMNSLDFFAAEEKEKMANAIANGFRNGRTEVEAEVLTKDKRRIPHYFTGVVIDYEGMTCLMGMGVDITESRKVAAELLKQKELLESLINGLPGIFYLFDNTGKYLLWNKNHETVPGYSTEEMQSMYPLDFFEGEEKERVKKEIEKVFTTGYAEIEAEFLTKDGRKIPHYFNGIAIDYDNKPCLMGVGMDITEKKLLEQEIMDQKVQEQKKMTRAVLKAQEKERNKIGQELHDNVNQLLVGAKMYLGTIKDKHPDTGGIIKQSIGLVDNAINEIRTLTREQVTPQRQIDLKDLIQSLVDNLNRHSQIFTSFVYDIGHFTIKDDLKINIYRIVQEGINNILKHAGAEKVSITVRADQEGLHVMIDDDGKGFSDSVAGTRGVGITNILNRVESYNGRVLIESQPGSGCKIDIIVPI